MMMAALCVRVDADAHHLENFSFPGGQNGRGTPVSQMTAA